jgi:4-hydroxy-tetrahydrodipicolinate synthase
MFGRLSTAMATPFTTEGAIDWPQLEKLIEHLLNTGSDSIVVSGTTAESPTLTNEEKLDLFRFAVKQVAGRAKVIAGTGSNDTKSSSALSQEAEKLGVDGLMLVAPYYNKPSQEALYQHFRTIIESVSLPVMLYNVPGRTSVNVAPQTFVRLSELEQVVAIKEASGDLDQITALIRQLPERVAVYSGDDALTLPILAVGGAGVVSVASHILGQPIKKMINAYLDGEVKRANELNQQLYPAFKGLFLTSSPVPLKYALSKLGLAQPTVRLPLVELTEEEKQVTDQWLEELVLKTSIN